MPNRRLTSDERQRANALLADIRERLKALAGDDVDLLFAYRRKVFKELVYDERDTPMARRRLKLLKRKEQDGRCFHCQQPLPDSHCVLDRVSAPLGYTSANTHLICQPCDRRIQQERGYR